MVNSDIDGNFNKVYEAQLKKVESRIAGLFRIKNPVSLYDPCSYIMQSGGKRLRPILVLLSAKAVKSEYNQVYNAAAAVEILHNFTLVHDDIMDNADKRRGRPTLHKKYDLSTAILTGDNLIAIAYQTLLLDCRDNDKTVLNTFTTGVIEVCEGQSLDKEFETRNDVTLSEYLVMIKKKTAALLEMCCAIGGQLGRAGEKQINALAKYGRFLGMAFQLQDDLLDITAEEAEFGKIIGGDLVEGKKTFLFLRALEKSAGADRKQLTNVMKNKGIGKDEIGKYKDIYSRLGIVEETKKQIVLYTRKALKELDHLDDGEGKEMLYWLAKKLTGRSK